MKRGECPWLACTAKLDPETCAFLKLEVEHLYRFPTVSPAVSTPSPTPVRTPSPVSTRDPTPPVTEWVMPPGAPADGGVLRLSFLNGETLAVDFSRATKVNAIKEMIRREKGIELRKQRLIWSGMTVRSTDATGHEMTLGDHWPRAPDNSVQVIVVMLDMAAAAAAGQHSIQNVVLELEWRNTTERLDASCIGFSHRHCLGVADYGCTSREDLKGVTHSGDTVDPDRSVRKQTIKVCLGAVPGKVDRLFFAISAFKERTGSLLSLNPTVKFFDETAPAVQLADYQVPAHPVPRPGADAENCCAIIMCLLQRRGNGWEAVSVGRETRGNSWDYEPMKATCLTMC